MCNATYTFSSEMKKSAVWKVRDAACARAELSRLQQNDSAVRFSDWSLQRESLANCGGVKGW